MSDVEPNEVLCVLVFLGADYFVVLDELGEQDGFLSDGVLVLWRF